MSLARFLGVVAVAGLGAAVAVPQFTKESRQAEADKTCRDQYAAAVAAGKRPPMDLSEVKLIGRDRNGRICGAGALTWYANNSAAIR